MDKAGACGPTSGKKPLMTMARNPSSKISSLASYHLISLSDKSDKLYDKHCF